MKAKIIVSGQVQGVFYRDHTVTKAKELDLKGYVKNLPDGTVEILVQGDIKKIKMLSQWCHEGSPHSKVTNVYMDETDTEDFADFNVR